MNRLVLKGIGGLVALSSAGLLLWPSMGTYARQEQTEPTKPIVKPNENKITSLPLTQAVLYTNGVGYFEREGTIQGDAEIELQCRLGEVNDLLKSLVIQDLDRGKIGAVSLSGPVDQNLSSVSLEGFMENNPTWQEILLLARGTPVEVTMEPSSPTAAAPAPITGVMISIQSPTASQPDMGWQPELPGGPPGGGLGRMSPSNSVVPVKLPVDSEGQTLQLKIRNEARPEPARLQLLTSQGYATLRLDQIKRVKLLDQQLEQSIRTALSKVPRSYQALGSQQTTVRLRFEGAGQRRVRVGYLREQPMWKSSYRLVLDEKGAAQLQGWAIVENTSDEDWQNIRLKLVAGQPVSFRMDLHTTLQPTRPEASVPSYRPFLPTGHQALFDRQSGPIATLPSIGGEVAHAPGGIGAGGGLGGMGGGLGGGMGGGGFGGMSGRGLRLPGGATVRDFNAEKSAERSGDVEKNLQELTAQAAPIGSYFEYTIAELVTLSKGRTSMVPLLQTAIPAERLSLYQPVSKQRKPLLALRLRNESKMLLGAGPVTIFDRRQFVGEAQLPEVAIGAKTFLTYGVDAVLQVSAKSKTMAQASGVELRYSQLGGFVEKIIYEHTDTYQFTNRDTLPRHVLIEQARKPSVTPVKPAESKESDDKTIRYLTEVAAGQHGEFSVVTSSARESHREQSTVKSEPNVKAFAVDELGTMSVQAEELPEQSVSVLGKAGHLILTNRLQRRFQYTLKANEGRVWSGKLKHGIDHSWSVSRLPDGGKLENTELVLPFTVSMAQPTTITVLQEKTVEKNIVLSHVPAAELATILRDRAVMPEMKSILQQALTLQESKAQLGTQQALLQDRLKEIDVEQTRLRANMKDLPKEAPLYKRYLEKFDKQEQEIDEARELSRKNKQQEAEILKKMSELVQGLK